MLDRDLKFLWKIKARPESVRQPKSLFSLDCGTPSRAATRRLSIVANLFPLPPFGLRSEAETAIEQTAAVGHFVHDAWAGEVGRMLPL